MEKHDPGNEIFEKHIFIGAFYESTTDLHCCLISHVNIANT